MTTKKDKVKKIKVKKEKVKKEKEKNENLKLSLSKSNTEDNCLLGDIIDKDNEFFDNSLNLDILSKEGIQVIKPEERISKNRLTKYEMVRIIGERIKQLTMGAKPLVKNYASLSYEEIAIQELKKNMIPFKIRRFINNNYELWYLNELKHDHIIHLLD